MYELTVRSGATARDVMTLVDAMPPAVYLRYRAGSPSATDVVLVFRENPAGPEAPLRQPAGWAPSTDGIPDRGLTPHQMAMYDLITAAPDVATGTRILDLVTHAHPAAVVALGQMLHAARHGRCTCHE
ncbi:hypothetical protein BL253_28830 [Pseudofrankia asymbiotica]|uniref:Uncharacterized protein n=2 Tax=Pseudofrankia asymbiotica TaxID=1834516 RepID=A0A1V2I5G0_9ACTN|nr:hypothetical protein BL253_28830 [Pseudofrankia asymbiotica]